jgi:hypothetical protein
MTKDNTLPAGTPITWIHYALDGTNVARTGIVVDRAPTPPSTGYGSRRSTPGVKVVYWVHPDEADERDLYPIIAVGKATSGHCAHGRCVDGAGSQYVGKGDLFASWSPESPTGKLVADGLKALAAAHA